MSNIKDRSMMNRNEYLVAKAVKITPNQENSLLVSGHVDEVSLLEENESEIIVSMKVALPKKALQGADPLDAVLNSNYFIVGDLPQDAITKEMRQVCEVVPSNSVMVRYDSREDIIPPVQNQKLAAPPIQKAATKRNRRK